MARPKKNAKTPKRTVTILLGALRARKSGIGVAELTERFLPGAEVSKTRQALYRLEEQELARKERDGATVAWYVTDKGRTTEPAL